MAPKRFYSAGSSQITPFRRCLIPTTVAFPTLEDVITGAGALEGTVVIVTTVDAPDTIKGTLDAEPLFVGVGVLPDLALAATERVDSVVTIVELPLVIILVKTDVTQVVEGINGEQRSRPT